METSKLFTARGTGVIDIGRQRGLSEFQGRDVAVLLIEPSTRFPYSRVMLLAHLFRTGNANTGLIFKFILKLRLMALDDIHYHSSWSYQAG